MKHRSFGDFVDKKKRDSIRQLRIINKILEKLQEEEIQEEEYQY